MDYGVALSGGIVFNLAKGRAERVKFLKGEDPGAAIFWTPSAEERLHARGGLSRLDRLFRNPFRARG